MFWCEARISTESWPIMQRLIGQVTDKGWVSTIDGVSIDYRTSVNQLSTNTRWIVCEVRVRYGWIIGKVSVN